MSGCMVSPAHVTLVEGAAQLARQAGQPLTESGALDALSGAYAGLGMVTQAARAARRRMDVLAPLPLDAMVGHELLDALNVACEYSVGAGDLSAARASAGRVRELPMVVEEGHLATAQMIVTDAVAGYVAEARRAAELFREGWDGPAGRALPTWAGRLPPPRWHTALPVTTTPALSGWPCSTAWGCRPSGWRDTQRRSTRSCCCTVGSRPLRSTGSPPSRRIFGAGSPGSGGRGMPR
jgi:hypothetical protein